MKLSRIYSSKLYITSTRKDRIKAAINDPFNVELVQQISDYLDNDSKKLLKTAVEEKDAKIEELENKNSDSNEGSIEDEPLDDERNVFSPSYSGSHGPIAPPSDMGGDMGEGGSEEPGGEPGDTPEEPAPDTDVEESTQIPIEGSSKIEDIISDLINDLPVIKGTLNGRADTAGVIRLNVDDDELWIYYGDEVNLSDIMVDVIEALNGANYNHLTFNRLARSNNAIVFDITGNISEPIESEDKKEK